MYSGENSSFYYDRVTERVYLTGGHCTVCRGEVPEKSRLRYRVY